MKTKIRLDKKTKNGFIAIMRRRDYPAHTDAGCFRSK